MDDLSHVVLRNDARRTLAASRRYAATRKRKHWSFRDRPRNDQRIWPPSRMTLERANIVMMCELRSG